MEGVSTSLSEVGDETRHQAGVFLCQKRAKRYVAVAGIAQSYPYLVQPPQAENQGMPLQSLKPAISSQLFPARDIVNGASQDLQKHRGDRMPSSFPENPSPRGELWILLPLCRRGHTCKLRCQEAICTPILPPPSKMVCSSSSCTPFQGLIEITSSPVSAFYCKLLHVA